MTPLPRSRLQDPASAAGLSLLLLLTAAFWAARLLVPELVPEYPGPRREIIGMALMLIAIPSYFAAAVIAAQNHSVGLVVGLGIITRFHTARVINGLGAKVRFDLFAQDRLKPLARAGLADLLVIAGALALTPLQALDAQFRPYNYSFGFLVAVPAGAVLLLWPLAALHRRMRDEKASQLDALDRTLDGLARPATTRDFAELESLLSHRDRIQSCKTWPLDTAIFSRVFFYLVIPPTAWVGAALVEKLLDRLL